LNEREEGKQSWNSKKEVNYMDFIKARLSEVSTLDGGVILALSLGIVFLGPLVKWLAYAGILYGGYKVLKKG